MNQRPPPPRLDLPLLSRWIEPLAREGLADLFFEWRSELHLSLRDGAIGGSTFTLESAVSARARRGDRIVLAASPRADETGAREAVRRLAGKVSSSQFPKNVESEPDTVHAETDDPSRWTKKVSGLITRAFESRPHKVEIRRRQVTRLVVPAARPAHQHERRRLSLHGDFLADTRGGPQWRAFNFHLPESDDGAFEELRARLRALAGGGPGPLAPTAGVADVMLDNGSAAFFFHEVLSHPMEADAPASRLSNLVKARLCPREIEVADEPRASTSSAAIPSTTRGSPRGAPLSSRRDIWRARSGTGCAPTPSTPRRETGGAPLPSSTRRRGVPISWSGRAARAKRRCCIVSPRVSGSRSSKGAASTRPPAGSASDFRRPRPFTGEGSASRLGPATSKARSWKRWRRSIRFSDRVRSPAGSSPGALATERSSRLGERPLR